MTGYSERRDAALASMITGCISTGLVSIAAALVVEGVLSPWWGLGATVGGLVTQFAVYAISIRRLTNSGGTA